MAREQRRLAAILAADVVGFSRLVGKDEAGTLARLNALRSDIVDPTIARHSGRLFKAMGDGFLVEFASAVQAVSCAKAIQDGNTNSGLHLRIGIHLGDVVVQGDDLLGDGVNIAARVEGVAEPGGIAISRQVHDQVRDKLDIKFVDKGQVELKNLVRPVRVFAFGGAKQDVAPTLALPDKPSIAVLPFQNMSGDPEQEYFADGIVEDIITALSRFRSLFVIARNSSFTYKGRAVDIKQVGRELGVRYVLEGSVRKAGGRVRITGQLIDSQTGAHLWADRFEGALEDIFELQDRVAVSVVGAIVPRLDQAEIERARTKPAASLNAYDHLLRAMWELSKLTRDGAENALQHCRAAMRLDPDYVAAHVWAVIAYTRRMQSGWMTNAEAEFADGARLGRRVLELAQDDPDALTAGGFAIAFLARDLDAGLSFVDRAMALNPNAVLAWHGSGWIRTYIGQPEVAIEHLQHAIRLSPLDPTLPQMHLALSIASRCAGRYEEAIGWATRVVHAAPDLVPGLVSLSTSQALAGHLEQARATMKRLMQLAPDARIFGGIDWFSFFRREQDREVSRRGARLAGMPEGEPAPALALPDKPSIAVLPFQNMSGDPEQEYFTDGVSEDIITELSRFRSLFVIARNSSFSYKGKSPDVRAVGRELGVRYVLEGSIRKSANRIRVTGQLIDTLTGSHIWAERYDRVLEDIFAVQEEVTQAIVAAIAPQITLAERSKATRRRPGNLSAYEIALRAWVHMGVGHDKVDRALVDQSLREAREALAIDPTSVLALQALVRAHGGALFIQMAPDREQTLREAEAAISRALELDEENAYSYAQRGLLRLQRGQTDRYPEGLADVRRAHEMNPNDVEVLRILATLETAVGEAERALEHLQHVMRLDPRASRNAWTFSLLSFAYLGAKRYREGIDWAQRALQDMPRMLQPHVNLVCCLVGAGEIEKAKATFEAGQRLAPEFFRVRLDGSMSPFTRPEDRKRLQMFLRVAAGLEDPAKAEAVR